MSLLDARKNFAIATVVTGYDDSATTITIESGYGSRFPDPATDGEFNLVWWDSSIYPSVYDDPNREIVRCTARSGDVFTIQRAQENTTATDKNMVRSVYKVHLGPTANTIDQIESELNLRVTYKTQIDDIVVTTKEFRSNFNKINSLIGTYSALIENGTEFYSTGSTFNHAACKYNGYFYGAGWNPKTFWRINPTTKTLLTKSVTSASSNFGQEVQLNGRLYVSGDQEIFEVDPTTLDYTVINTRNYVSYPTIATDGTYLYVPSWADGILYKIDSEGNDIDQLDLGALKLHWIAYDSETSSLFITSADTPTSKIFQVDVNHFNLVASSTITGMPTDDNVIVGNDIWLGLEAGANKVVRISKDDLTDQDYISIPHSSYGIADGNDGYIYISSNLTNIVTKMSVSDWSYTSYSLYDPSGNVAPNEFLVYNGFYMNTRWGYDGVYVRTSLPTDNTIPTWDNRLGTTYLGTTYTYDLTAIGSINAGGNIDIGGYFHMTLTDPIEQAFYITDQNTGFVYDMLDMVSYKRTFYSDIDINGYVNFNAYKAIALSCDNGATLPTSPTPTIGQWFRLITTGRDILYQYSGSAWSPIVSFGALTCYVDGTNGTDSPEKGTATGASAFKTIQYAVNQVPPINDGSVIAYVAKGTYSEAVSIQGKAFTGPYTLSIIGDELNTGTLVTSQTTGFTYAKGGITSDPSGVTRSTITKTGAFTGLTLRGYYIQYNNTGNYYPIHSNSNDVLQIADNTVANGTVSSFKIYQAETIISRTSGTNLTVAYGQNSVFIYNIKLTNTGTGSTFLYQPNSTVDMINCWVQGGNVAAGTSAQNSVLNFTRSYLYQGNANRFGITLGAGSSGIMTGSMFYTDASGTSLIRANQLSQVSGNPSYYAGTGTQNGINVVGGQVTLFGQNLYNLSRAVPVDDAGMVTYQTATFATFDTCTTSIEKGYALINSTLRTNIDGIVTKNTYGYDTAGGFNYEYLIDPKRFGDKTTNYVQIGTNGDVSFIGSSGLYPRTLNQAAAPVAGTGATQLDTGEMCYWIDSGTSALWLCYNQAGTVKKVQLT